MPSTAAQLALVVLQAFANRKTRREQEDQRARVLALLAKRTGYKSADELERAISLELDAVATLECLGEHADELRDLADFALAPPRLKAALAEGYQAIHNAIGRMRETLADVAGEPDDDDDDDDDDDEPRAASSQPSPDVAKA